MDRTILVTVGISLVSDRIAERERADAGFGNLEGPFRSLSLLHGGLLVADQKADTFNPDEPRWVNARHALARKLAEIWGREEARLLDGFKRAWSGAELASLSLLGQAGSDHPPLNATDRVILLASQTPSGQFCAHTIAAALRAGLLGVDPSNVRVEVVPGLRADDAVRFLEEGLPNTARQLAEFRTNSLLIASGGYKGLLPYLTPIAMQLKIPMLYLYEESDRLIEVLPFNLFESLDILATFPDAFSRINPLLGSGTEYAAVFWDDVKNQGPPNGQDIIEKSGLVERVSTDSIKITPVGRLACHLQPLLSPKE